MSFLIRQCVCGATAPFDVVRGPLEIENARCRCGVIFQLTTRSAFDVDAEYAGAYHASADRHPCLVPYAARYDADRTTAAIRIRAYGERLGHVFRNPNLRVLDVGCANGAFVDELVLQGVDAYGIDPDPVGGERDRIARCTLETGALGRYELLTYHDVLEHLVDPLAELRRARAHIAAGGAIVVDVPDVADPFGAKHFKREHLWYFTLGALHTLLERAGFEVGVMYRPIPGKVVVIGRVA